MEAIIAFTVLALFIFTVLLLVYGALKYASFIYRSRNEKAVENLVSSFKFSFFSNLGGNRTLLRLFIAAIVIAAIIVFLKPYLV